MTKNVQDTPLSAGVNWLFGGSEGGGGLNGIQVNPVGQVDEASGNVKAVGGFGRFISRCLLR